MEKRDKGYNPVVCFLHKCEACFLNYKTML